MGKLTYVNMMEQLRAIHDSASKEDAKVKIEGSYSDDKEETRERDCFIVIAVRREMEFPFLLLIVKMTEASITEAVVIIQEEKRKKEEVENRRTLKIEMATYHSITFVNLFIIGPLIAQKKDMKQKYPCFQIIFKSAVWLSFYRKP